MQHAVNPLICQQSSTAPMKASEHKQSCKQSNPDVEPLIRRGYTFGSTIGEGSYGNVMQSSYTDPMSGQVKNYACKTVNKLKAPKDFLQKFFPREIDILTKVEHPNIIGINSILQSGNTVFIFMPLASGGDLLNYIKKNGAISEARTRMWFSQIVSAVKYLHDNDIAHRDLKCENLLISEHLNMKIADFGFARSCVDDEQQKVFSETYCGSASYAAPEIIAGEPYDPRKSDVWSLGVVLFIMLNGLMPFDDANLGRMIRDQKNRRYHIREEMVGHLSQNCKATIHSLLDPNPSKRPNISAVCRMPWLSKYFSH